MLEPGHWIGGEERPAASGERFEDRAPATGKLIARVARGGAEDVARAVAAAREALAGPWGKTGPAERAELLDGVADLLKSRTGDLAELDVPLNDLRLIGAGRHGRVFFAHTQ